MLLDEVVVFMTTVSLFKTFNSNCTDHWYGVFYIHQNFKLDFRVQYAKQSLGKYYKEYFKDCSGIANIFVFKEKKATLG